MPKRKKKKDCPVFRPLSLATRSKCRCLKEEEIYGEIMTIAESAETPLSTSAIHVHIGGPDVCSVWIVRGCLFNMQNNQIMKKISDDSWILYEKCDALEGNNNEAQAEDCVHMNDATCVKKLTVTKKLLSVMSNQEARDIGEITIALGEEQTRISRLLHFLENKKVVSKLPNNRWILLRDFKDIEIPKLQEEIPDIFENEDHTTLNTDCMCSNAGDRCHHLHINFNQNWTVNNYVQNGNGNRMFTGRNFGTLSTELNAWRKIICLRKSEVAVEKKISL